MPDTMFKRLAMALLPEMHHGIGDATESPETSAYRLARKVLMAMREPTDTMIDAGEAAPRTAGANMAGAEAAYIAMIEAALRESDDDATR